MAAAFPAAGVVYNHGGNGTIDCPPGHGLHAHFGIASVVNAAAGTRDYPIGTLQSLFYSLSVRDPNNPAALDNVFYAVDGVDILAIMQCLATAVNAGFTHRVVPTGNVTRDGNAIIRAAQLWASNNVARLRPCVAGDFYAYPPMAGGANPPRNRMPYSLLVEQGSGVMRAVAELIGLSGHLHDALSRNNQGKYAVLFDQTVDHLGDPPVALQPFAVAQAFRDSGLPPTLRNLPCEYGGTVCVDTASASLPVGLGRPTPGRLPSLRPSTLGGARNLSRLCTASYQLCPNNRGLLDHGAKHLLHHPWPARGFDLLLQHVSSPHRLATAASRYSATSGRNGPSRGRDMESQRFSHRVGTP